jgi:asparagine synthase (glutamine-hydrolysing)
MCGIFGAVELSRGALRQPSAVRAMGEHLIHRGPDEHGILEREDAILGNRRLSIIDLAVEANQPFASPDASVWLVCNGEIYNAPDLRKRYSSQGYPFRSDHNDVEAILPLYLEYGEEAIARLDGMFGLAIWDARRSSLLLARDRAGEKPLFFARRGQELRFASEIQALLVAEQTRPEVSPGGLSDFLALGYCLAPRTMFAGIEKLEAGHLLVASAAGTRIRRYWDAREFATAQRYATPREILAGVEEAVGRQIVSDVPLGVFTSGGLDSSLLAGVVVNHLPAETVNTYAIRFEEQSYDESDCAERICHALGTRHHTVSASEAELFRALEVISDGVAEPLGDPAILPTYLLAEAARRDVKVILSGEGADELFGGYPTYLGHRWAERFRALPDGLRGSIGSWVHRIPVSTSKVSLEFLAKRFVEEAEREPCARHVAWFGALGPEASAFAVRGSDLDRARLWQPLQAIPSVVKQAMLFDQATYLAENLLTKVDRATMLASVEARAPFIDRALMELALRQPVDGAVGAFRTKLALKRAALRRLPRWVVHRRKRGLSVPVASWINGSLRGEVDDLLAADRLRHQGLLRTDAVAPLLAQHRSGEADHARRLWPLVMFQRWHERWVEQPLAARPAPRLVAQATTQSAPSPASRA